MHLLPRWSTILLFCAILVLAGACDAATPTQVPPTSKPTFSQPVGQGWVIKLGALTKENNYQLSFDVLAPGGWSLGTLQVTKGAGYQTQGDMGLISSVRIAAVVSDTQANTANSSLLLELAASQGVVQGGQVEVAQAGRTYEKSTPEGWRVSATVQTLSVDEHPKLSSGAAGQVPVFKELALDVEIEGSGPAPYVGITADSVTRSRAAAENLRGPDLELLDHGVVVRQVTAGSPAAVAGLQPGDVILALDDAPIDEFTPLSVLVGRHKVGDTVRLDVVRDTKPLKVALTLQKRP